MFTEILFESTVKGLAGIIGLSKKLVGNTAYRKKVEHYLRLIDVGIKRLDVQTETIFDEHTAALSGATLATSLFRRATII